MFKTFYYNFILESSNGPFPSFIASQPNEPSADTCSVQQETNIINHENIIAKCSDTIKNNLKQNNSPLSSSQKQELARIAANYMMEVLKDTSRGIAQKIAVKFCNTYENSFSIVINETTCDKGIDVIREKILARIYYLKDLSKKHASRKRPLNEDEENSSAAPKKKNSCEIDEYGCVNYRSELPPEEDETT